MRNFYSRIGESFSLSLLFMCLMFGNAVASAGITADPDFRSIFVGVDEANLRITADPRFPSQPYTVVELIELDLSDGETLIIEPLPGQIMYVKVAGDAMRVAREARIVADIGHVYFIAPSGIDNKGTITAPSVMLTTLDTTSYITDDLIVPFYTVADAEPSPGVEPGVIANSGIVKLSGQERGDVFLVAQQIEHGNSGRISVGETGDAYIHAGVRSFDFDQKLWIDPGIIVTSLVDEKPLPGDPLLRLTGRVDFIGDGKLNITGNYVDSQQPQGSMEIDMRHFVVNAEDGNVDIETNGLLLSNDTTEFSVDQSSDGITLSASGGMSLSKTYFHTNGNSQSGSQSAEVTWIASVICLGGDVKVNSQPVNADNYGSIQELIVDGTVYSDFDCPL